MKRVFWLRFPNWIIYSVICSFAALGLLLSLEVQLLPALVVQSGIKISRLGRIFLGMLDFVQLGF